MYQRIVREQAGLESDAKVSTVTNERLTELLKQFHQLKIRKQGKLITSKKMGFVMKRVHFSKSKLRVNSYRKTLIQCVLTLVYLSLPNNVFADWLEYEPKIVVLYGLIEKDRAYGPPNFGETPEQDKKIEYYLIHLDSPVKIKGNSGNDDLNTATYKRIDRIQLLHFGTAIKLKTFLNKRVKIEGSLFQAMTGHHFTKVLCTIKKMQESP